MNKYTLCLLPLFFLCLSVSAQKQKTYFVKKDGQQVTERDSADFIRIVQEPEKGSKLFLVNESYKDGTQKSVGFSSKLNTPSYEGIYKAYYKNGKIKQIANYENGDLTDTTHNYYPNGQLHTTFIYYSAHSVPVSSPAYYIQTVNDSTGKSMVTNGNGECSLYDGYIHEKGIVKKGHRDGVWTGNYVKSGLIYTETYANGLFISGESKDDKGTVSVYTNPAVQPEFTGGMKQFYKFLGKNTIYPPNCFRQNIQGVVILRFTVEKDGSLNDIKVINDVNPELAAEAVRVLKLSPNWIPGLERGKIVRVAYHIPVTFALK